MVLIINVLLYDYYWCIEIDELNQNLHPILYCLRQSNLTASSLFHFTHLKNARKKFILKYGFNNSCNGLFRRLLRLIFESSFSPQKT